MQPSFLQIEKIKFLETSLKAAPKAVVGGNCQIESHISVLQNQNQPTQWKVELGIQIHGEEAPYRGEIKAVGDFNIRGSLPEESALNLVNVNGPAILYGAIREMVFYITSRGPYEPLLMPSVTFIDRKMEKDDPVQDSKEGAEQNVIAEPKSE